MFRLFCYIRQDDYNEVFLVEIEEDAEVTILKERIKEKKTPILDHIAANSLVLWNKPVPFNKSLKETVNALSLGDDFLQALDILSDVLPSVLEKRTVHIIVDRPPSAISPFSFLQLFCYVRDDDYKHAFEVKIRMNDSVASLKQCIKEVAGQTFVT